MQKKGDITMSTMGKLIILLVAIILIIFIFSGQARTMAGKIFNIGETTGTQAEDCVKDITKCKGFGDQQQSTSPSQSQL